MRITLTLISQLGTGKQKNIKRESLLNLGNENLFLYKVLVLFEFEVRTALDLSGNTTRGNTKYLYKRNARYNYIQRNLLRLTICCLEHLIIHKKRKIEFNDMTFDALILKSQRNDA